MQKVGCGVQSGKVLLFIGLNLTWMLHGTKKKSINILLYQKKEEAILVH